MIRLDLSCSVKRSWGPGGAWLKWPYLWVWRSFSQDSASREGWSTIPVLDLFGIETLGWVQSWKEWAYYSILRHDSSLASLTTLSPYSPSLAPFANCSMQFLLRRRIHRQWVARRALVCGSGKNHCIWNVLELCFNMNSVQRHAT